MLRNYLITAIRNLRRNKVYSFINIAGLAVGMAAFILVGLYVSHEFSYDRHHANADRIVRVIYEDLIYGGSSASAPEGVGSLLEETFPEVGNFVRISGAGNTVRVGTQTFNETTVIQTEQSFFDIFTVESLSGNLSTALLDPGTVVLTERQALTLFGRRDVVGETLDMVRGSQTLPYRVTAVIGNFPSTSHLNAGVIAHRTDSGLRGWDGSSATIYLLLTDKASASDLEGKLPALVDEHAVRVSRNSDGEEFITQLSSERIALHLQPLTDIHLHPNFAGPLASTSRLDPVLYLYIFLLTAAIILLIACTNYANMTLAMTLRRLEEVGVRKTVGADKGQIVAQFLTESLLTCLLAAAAALAVVEIMLPPFNALVDKDLSLGVFADLSDTTQLGLFVLFVGLVSGGYPAYLISRPTPNQLLHEAPFGITSKGWLRKGLIVFQFSASIALILITLTIINQMRFVRASRLNVDGDTVIYLENRGRPINESYQAFKNSLLEHPSVLSVTTGRLPGRAGGGIIYAEEDDGISGTVDNVFVDLDYTATLGLELVSGRLFEASDQIDFRDWMNRQQEAFAAARAEGPVTLEDLQRIGAQFARPTLVNESALKWLDIEDPIGHYASRLNMGRIIGVVKDFHVRSLHQAITPVAIQLSTTAAEILIRYEPNQVPEGVAATEEIWRQFAPNSPFEYTYLNDEMDKNYQAEMRMGTILGWFTFLAVLIAAIGLFGLAAYAAERRTKEIGIRKVAGASVGQIVGLLSREFLVLVLIANIIAWPIAWYAMNRWLENFAYRIDLGVGIFILAGALALVIALATVSYQAIKAATANPVEALRYE